MEKITNDIWGALDGADAVLLSTAHEEYGKLDFARLWKVMRTPVLIDGRNLWSQEAAREAGFAYRCVGKGN